MCQHAATDEVLFDAGDHQRGLGSYTCAALWCTQLAQELIAPASLLQ
jgi:hypothetical protein